MCVCVCVCVVEVALTSVLGSALGQALRTWDAWQAAQKHHMRRVMLLQETRQLAAIQVRAYGC